MYRSAGSINFKDLESHVRWLAKEVQGRGMGVSRLYIYFLLISQ